MIFSNFEKVSHPAGIYLAMETAKKLWELFKINNKATRTMSWRRSGIFIVNFEQISHNVLVVPVLI